MRLHWMLLALAVAACNRDPMQQPVARVDGEPVTRFELDLAERRLLGGQPAQDALVRRRILESLVLNRAIAQETALDEHERAVVEAEMRAHRDQFLARLYLARQPALPGPSAAEIARYYDGHPALFGAEPDHRYEMIVAGRTVDRASLEKHAADADWPRSAASLKARGIPAEFRRGSSRDLSIEPVLRARVEALPVAQARIVEAGGRVYLARVVEHRQSPARPLEEVRPQVLQALAAIQLRDAVDRAGKAVLKDVEVEYLE